MKTRHPDPTLGAVMGPRFRVEREWFSTEILPEVAELLAA